MKEPHPTTGRLLVRVGFYNAPGGCPIVPYRVPEGTELVELLTGGKVYFSANGEERLYERGTMFWHRGGEFTICKTPPDAPYRCVVFNLAVAPDVRQMPQISQWNDAAEVERFSVDALSLHLDHATDKGVLGDYVIGVLARHALLRNRGGIDRTEDYSPRMRNLLNLIGANIQRRISVEELSRHCQISRPYIFRLFREEMGVTPHQYITSLQIDRAQLLLASSAKSIKEIAFNCGFESIEVFYRRFRNAVGQTPGEYRRAKRPYHFSED